MYLGIAATSCECERSFRSSGLILTPERTRLSIDHLQQEHRVQQHFSVGGEKLSAHEWRKIYLERAAKIINQFQVSLKTEKQDLATVI